MLLFADMEPEARRGRLLDTQHTATRGRTVLESWAVLLQHAGSFPTAPRCREARVTSQSLLPHATPTHTVPSPGENSLKTVNKPMRNKIRHDTYLQLLLRNW